MSRFAWAFCLTSTVIAGASGTAEASRLTLTYFAPGYALGPAYGPTESVWGHVDATDGPPEIVLNRPWVATGDGTTRSIGGPIAFQAFLYETDKDMTGRSRLEVEAQGRLLAEVSLVGSSAGFIKPWGDRGASMSTASASGSADVADLEIKPGVDASRVPSWLSELHLSLTTDRLIDVGPPNRSYTEVRVLAVPVPEPGSVVVFLAVAGGGLAMARRPKR